MSGFGLGFSFGLGSAGGSASLIPVPSPRNTIQDNETNFSDYTLTEVTINNDAASNYLGTGLCDQSRETATTGIHAFNQTQSVLANGRQYAADFVLKPDGRSHALFQLAGGGNNFYACFDFTDNTIGLTAGPLDSWTITDLSNGWKHLRMVFTSVDAAAYGMNIYHATSNTVYTGIVGDVTKGFLIDRYVLSYTA